MARNQSRLTIADIAPKTDPSRGYARHCIWQALGRLQGLTDLRTISLGSGIGQADCKKILAQLQSEGFVTRAGNTYKPTYPSDGQILQWAILHSKNFNLVFFRLPIRVTLNFFYSGRTISCIRLAISTQNIVCLPYEVRYDFLDFHTLRDLDIPF